MKIKITVTKEKAGLKTNRKLSGMDQEEIAKKTGIPMETIRQYEDGSLDLNNAPLTTLLKLCEALDCEMTDLLTDPGVIKAWNKHLEERYDVEIDDEDEDDEEEEFEDEDPEEEEFTTENADKILNKLEKIIQFLKTEKDE